AEERLARRRGRVRSAAVGDGVADDRDAPRVRVEVERVRVGGGVSHASVEADAYDGVRAAVEGVVRKTRVAEAGVGEDEGDLLEVVPRRGPEAGVEPGEGAGGD